VGRERKRRKEVVRKENRESQNGKREVETGRKKQWQRDVL